MKGWGRFMLASMAVVAGWLKGCMWCGVCVQAAIHALQAGVAAEQARREREAAAEAAKKAALKVALEHQMRQNAARK